jgi:hypothetical protein
MARASQFYLSIHNASSNLFGGKMNHESTLRNVVSLMILLLALGYTNSAIGQEVSSAGADAGGVSTSSVTSSHPAQAPDDTNAAAKNAAQNPVASVISVPFQGNTGFGVGPYRRAENETLIEPVVPVRLSENWVLITRTITPIVVVPRVSPTDGVHYGLGDMQPQFYLSPAHPGKFMWGVGPQLYLPTASDEALSPVGRKWGGGVGTAGLASHGHWLVGMLISNQWAGLNHNHINELTLNPFVYYNLKHSWYLVSSDIMTADWTASRNQRWTVPAGGGVGKIFKLGPQMLNARAQAWSVTQRPDGGPSWVLQTEVQFLYPHKPK